MDHTTPLTILFGITGLLLTALLLEQYILLNTKEQKKNFLQHSKPLMFLILKKCVAILNFSKPCHIDHSENVVKL